ncbi:4695_t:CDS:1, partial [Paraglomus brasilianum]
MLLISFPLDIILHILDLLTFEDLVALSQTDKGHYSIIQEHGYKLYYIKQKWKILTKSILSSDWRTKVKYGLRTLKNWENKRFSTNVIARQRQCFIPSLRFDTEKLVCTVGGDLDIRYFDSNDRTKFDQYRFFPAHAGDIVDIHLSSNGELFTSSTDTTIKR